MDIAYKNYTATDFLEDESFLKSLLFSSQEDIDYWNDFLEKYPEKEAEIKRANEIFNSLTFNKETFSLDEKYFLLENINKQICEHSRKKTLKIRRAVSVAAGFAILLSFSYMFFYRSIPEFFAGDFHKQKTVVNNGNIQLILNSHESVDLDRDAKISYSKDGNIVVDSEEKKLTTLNIKAKNKHKINKLIVPKGKRSFLTLEDGTKIWVNSGTTLEFPGAFRDDRREIYIDGEAYIEVSKDKQRPFYLKTSGLEIKVMGTRFNVSAYSGDVSQSVVLVEGSVEVKSNKHQDKKLMIPEQMLHLTSSGWNVKKVNVYSHISWKDGLLQFESENLSVILAKISRYYNIPIDCQEDIKGMKCTGKLVLFDDFQEVLKIISNTIPVKIEKDENYIYIRKV